MANAHRICEANGVYLRTNKGKRHPRTPVLPKKETWARGTIKRVAERGIKAGHPDHVHNVLSLMVKSPRASCMLFGEVIDGVSLWMLRKGITARESAALAPVFDEINLTDIRLRVLHHRLPERAPQIAVFIAELMEDDVKEVVNG